ncbi:twin transmembrane helix small protein [Celeribacter marinus]|uniref:twin transmembrane helix small protein n=1 Tax=Celeribacter marinus TaxID=1397108 RepID=UPI003F6C1164
MSPFIYLIGIGCAIVVLILARGISHMGRGGIDGAKKSNKMMKWRIIAQLVVVIIVVIFVALGGNK